jgi:hypothetical protein
MADGNMGSTMVKDAALCFVVAVAMALANQSMSSMCHNVAQCSALLSLDVGKSMLVAAQYSAKIASMASLILCILVATAFWRRQRGNLHKHLLSVVVVDLFLLSGLALVMHLPIAGALYQLEWKKDTREIGVQGAKN